MGVRSSRTEQRVGEVAELGVAAIKGTRLVCPKRVEVGLEGVIGSRRFFLRRRSDQAQIDARTGPVQAIHAAYDAGSDVLTLRFPDGATVAERLVRGQTATALITWDAGRPVHGTLIEGRFAEALSAHVGTPVELIEVGAGQHGYDVAPVTLVSHASIARLATKLGVRELDGRRFRMNLTLAGPAAHEEDRWRDRELTVGTCRLRVGGPVPRCVAVTHDPDSGDRDHPVLKAIVNSRAPGVSDDGEPVRAPFGVYAQVTEPGAISVGDPVLLH